jgi:hypothetical protein
MGFNVVEEHATTLQDGQRRPLGGRGVGLHGKGVPQKNCCGNSNRGPES